MSRTTPTAERRDRPARPARRLLACAALAAALALGSAAPAEAGWRLVITRPSGGGSGNDAAARAAYARVNDARRDLWRATYDARQRRSEDAALVRAERDADAARRHYGEVRRRAVRRAAGDPDYARLRREIFDLEQRFPDIVAGAGRDDDEADDLADAPPPPRATMSVYAVVSDAAADAASTVEAPPPDRAAAARVLLERRDALSKLRRKLIEGDPDLLDAWYAMQDADALAADLRADLNDVLADDPGVKAARAQLAAARDALAAISR